MVVPPRHLVWEVGLCRAEVFQHLKAMKTTTDERPAYLGLCVHGEMSQVVKGAGPRVVEGQQGEQGGQVGPAGSRGEGREK